MPETRGKTFDQISACFHHTTARIDLDLDLDMGMGMNKPSTELDYLGGDDDDVN